MHIAKQIPVSTKEANNQMLKQEKHRSLLWW